jgi:hypothetical protein
MLAQQHIKACRESGQKLKNPLDGCKRIKRASLASMRNLIAIFYEIPQEFFTRVSRFGLI